MPNKYTLVPDSELKRRRKGTGSMVRLPSGRWLVRLPLDTGVKHAFTAHSRECAVAVLEAFNGGVYDQDACIYCEGYLLRGDRRRRGEEKLPRQQRRIATSLRFEIFIRDDYRCQICGRDAADGVKLTVDHRIPAARGGADTHDNLWTLCYDCNAGKASRIVSNLPPLR